MSEEGNIQVKDEILSILDNNKELYGNVKVQSAIVKENDVWKNIVTKIVPLYKNEKNTSTETLDYGDFVMIEDIISVNDLAKKLGHLITEEKFTIKGHTLQKDESIYFEKERPVESGNELFNVGWSADWYMVRINERSRTHIQSEPLLTLKNPLFPDAYHAIKSWIGLDLLGHDGLIGKIIILLPNYRAKIKSVKINSKQLDIEVETKEIALKDILGKVWCEGEEGEETQEDISFDQPQKTISVEYTLKDVYVYLLSKSRGEVIDYWQWLSRRFPKEMRMDMTTDEILELIKNGENQQVEFKEEEVKADKLAKELVAFANTNDGIILMGVDDEGNIKGVDDTKGFEGTIRDIAQNNCNPSIQLRTVECDINNKKILLIFVPQGRHKPYQRRTDGKIFVRRGSTSRSPDPTEVKELTKNI
ncbi:hypothetical protein ES705_18272 [subsurface metagenome]|nr:hypothetical protein [Methanosarcinales archaeon]